MRPPTSSGAGAGGSPPLRIASISASRARSKATVARYHGVSSRSVASSKASASRAGSSPCSRTTARSSAACARPSEIPRPSEGFVQAQASPTLATPAGAAVPLPLPA